MTASDPPGTRDVLPDEMRELRAISGAHARRLRGRRLRRGAHARARVRGGAAPRRGARGRRPLPHSSTSRASVLALRSDMTIPIARVVATRYARRRAPAALLLLRARLARRRARARAAARVPPGRARADRLAGAGGRRRGAGADDRRARRGRPAPPPGGRGRRRRSTAHCSTALGVAEERAPAAARVPVAPRPGRRSRCACRALGPGRRASATCSSPAPAARRPRGARAGRRAARRGRAACARCTSCSRRARRGRPGDLRPRAGARARLLHGRGVRGLRPRVGFALGGGGRYDDLLGPLRPALPAVRDRADVQRVHMAQAAEEALGVSLTIAVPRGALFEGTLDLLDAPRASTRPRCASNDRKLLFAEPGIVTMRPVRRAHLRRARLRPTSASRARTCCSSSRSARSTSCSTSASARCRMVVAARRGGDPIG